MYKSAIFMLLTFLGFTIADRMLVQSNKPIVETELFLHADNTVVLWDEVSDESIGQVILDIQSKKSKDIYLVINTYGGSVRSAFALQKFISTSDLNVHTISLNSISSGYIITQLLGTRYVTSSSYLMMHNVFFPLSPMTDMPTLKEMTRSYFYAIDQIYRPLYSRVGIPDWKFRQSISPELALDYNKALKGNHADKLVRITCSKDLVDYDKVYQINASVYGIRFPGCPTASRPLSVYYIYGEVNPLLDSNVLRSRFFPGRG